MLFYKGLFLFLQACASMVIKGDMNGETGNIEAVTFPCACCGKPVPVEKAERGPTFIFCSRTCSKKFSRDYSREDFVRLCNRFWHYVKYMFPTRSYRRGGIERGLITNRISAYFPEAEKPLPFPLPSHWTPIFQQFERSRNDYQRSHPLKGRYDLSEAVTPFQLVR